MPRLFVTCFTFAALAAILSTARADEPPAEVGIAAPPGFEVALFADDALAHDIFSMTLDSQGRVVVAGPNYVKTLHDRDGDGRADEATLFSAVPASGAHGMVFDGHDLVCTGDNAVGRLRDADGDGRADGAMEVWANLRHPEHGANGIVRGPDGWFHLICGNDAGVSAAHAQLPGSPVKEPRCGAVVRFSPIGARSEVYAHGFRNPYDLDFSAEGNLFTVDADGERDHHLPWYAPTRLFDVAQGMEHGWLLQGWQRSWNRPESFFDNVERLAEIGRGSPTGLVVYRHRQFPAKYRNAVLGACWTLGRVYAFPLERHEASFRTTPEVFLQTTGDVGFAPVDLAVGPEGDLFVAIGGRGTRGGVFRVRYVGEGAQPVTVPDDPLDRVLSANQPLAAWSRARWFPLARRLGRAVFEAAVVEGDREWPQRVRAVEVLVEAFDGIEAGWAEEAVARVDPETRARIAWALGRSAFGLPIEHGQRVLAFLTHDDDPRVQRAAWEALATCRPYTTWTVDEDVAADEPNWAAALTTPVRRVRDAAIAAPRTFGRFNRVLLPDDLYEGPSARYWLAQVRHYLPTERARSVFGRSFARDCLPRCGAIVVLREHSDFDDPTIDDADRLEAVRIMQVLLGDVQLQEDAAEVYSGYAGAAVDVIGEKRLRQLTSGLAPAFPTDDAELNRELARLLGMLLAEDPRLLEAIAAQWTEDSSLTDDIHYLIVFSRLPGELSAAVTAATAAALARLHHKLILGDMHPSRNWPLRVGECFDELLKRDPALPQALLEQAAFRLADQSPFAARLPDEFKRAAARKLLAVAESADEDAFAWTPELVEVVAALPADESLPVLREKWDDYGLRDAILLALASDPQPADRPRFVEAFDSTQPEVIVRAAEALRILPTSENPAEIAAALRTLRQYCGAKEQFVARQAIAALLAHWIGRSFAIDETGSDTDLLAVYRPWFDWFAATHPDEAAKLSAAGSVDAAAWRERLAAVVWDEGDAMRGQGAFEKRACHRCHRGTSRLGPDLVGAAGRFSREDLFTAILDPNKDVSPLYQTQAAVTRGGLVYYGLLVYESPESTLVQTGPDTTVRVAGDDLESIRPSRNSLMPVGLLNELSDRDLADLYAYLRTLKAE